MLPRPPRSPLFPYTTLFRSQGAIGLQHLDYYLDEFAFRFNRRKSRSRGKLFYRLVQQAMAVDPVPYKAVVRSEEHTSELQSQFHLVCRLLLEKKKQILIALS